MEGEGKNIRYMIMLGENRTNYLMSTTRHLHTLNTAHLRFYNDALNAACGEGLFGLFIMLVSAVISALFFTILVWCNSHTWIYFKHKGKYVKVEDQVRKTSIYEIGDQR